MTRNYKYKLYASKHSKELSRMVTSANFVWNHIVTLSRRYYRMYKKSLSPARIKKHMVKIYRNQPYWSKFHTHSLQEICERYENALNQAIKKKRGFPKAHKPHNNGSVLFKGSGGYKLYDNGKHGILVVNKLGRNWRFKFKVTRPWGDVKNIIIKRDCDGCLYLTVCCDVPERRLERENEGPIGMDFGMKTFLTLSNGERIDIPDYHKQSLKETRKADSSYSNKLNAKVYGTSFRRAKKARQKAHRKVTNRRSDFHWKLAHQLCKRFSFIAIEDLNIKGMQRHKRWGRKISSLGYSEFVKKLEVVALKYGTEVKKIGRYEASSQTCSECGHKDSVTKDLKVREWTCPECGAVHDRDVNAAKNILRFGVAENTTGKGVSPDGSRGKTIEGIPSDGSGDGHVSCPAPSENPMTSVVGVRQEKTEPAEKKEKELLLDSINRINKE